MSIVLEKKLPIILLFALLMLAMMGYFAYRNGASLHQAINWEKKTLAILLNLNETLAAAVDIETAGRGFVITGQDEFLVPLKNGKEKSSENIRQLRDLFRDNPQQDELLSQLNLKVQEKIRYTERYIAYRRTLDLPRTVVEMSKNQEKESMDAIRSIAERMKNEELRLLKIREDNLQLTLDNNFWIMIVGTFAGTFSLAVANLVVLFEMRKRGQAERALREANTGLEQRVEERTLELEELNRELLQTANEKERFLLNEKIARREAEIANRQRDDFMAMISHELRTPLNSILGWAQILKAGELDARTHDKAVNTIISSAENQNRLIKDLLDVARIISGKLTLEQVKLNFGELVKSSIETVKPSADQKHISLNLKIDDNLKNTRIFGDPNRLQQIVWNLLTNAVKFTPESGRIEVSLSESDEWLKLIIRDNGVGISDEFLPFVFERFQQDQINIKQNGGLGLGLEIVRYLTEMHGGTVSVESEGENRGAAFTICLPVAANEKVISGLNQISSNR